METTSKDPQREVIRKVFRLNPELRQVGNESEYEKYLATIFPESTQQSIFWHGSPNEKFDQFSEEKVGDLDSGFYGRGFYFTPEWRLANNYRTRLQKIWKGRNPNLGQGSIHPCKLNLRKPFQMPDNYKYFMPDPNSPDEANTLPDEIQSRILTSYNQKFNEHKTSLSPKEFEYVEELREIALIGTEVLKGLGYDGCIAKNPVSKITEYLVFSSTDTHILGSKKDIENFKLFRQQTPNNTP